MFRILSVFWVAAMVGPGLARADLLYFVEGGRVQLPLTVDGDLVRLETPEGRREFARSDFRAIVPGSWPDQEWPARREAAVRAGGAPARFAAAWWALENGLTPEAIALLTEGRAEATGHEPTGRALAMIDALALPCPDPDLDPIRRRLLPARFREARGNHVVLLHQAGDADARERLDVLDRVIRTFYLTLAAQGIELATPRRRLVSVWFAERRDYAAFLRRSEAEPFADTQGYYHPGLGVVFAHDSRSSEGHRAARRAIENRRRDGASPSDLARQSLLLDLQWRATDLGIAGHETVHQLVAVSGLAPRTDDFPAWLHEGLAAQFEVIRGGRWAGVGRANDLRLPDWRSIRPAPRLAPRLRDDGFGQGYRPDAYAESWALVYFLRKTEPARFRTFLDLLRAPTPATSTHPARSSEAFRAAFGPDLEGLETAWRQYLAGIRTPLEANQPDPAAPPPPDSKSRLVGPDPAH